MDADPLSSSTAHAALPVHPSIAAALAKREAGCLERLESQRLTGEHDARRVQSQAKQAAAKATEAVSK